MYRKLQISNLGRTSLSGLWLYSFCCSWAISLKALQFYAVTIGVISIMAYFRGIVMWLLGYMGY